jgi:hypothetical protein
MIPVLGGPRDGDAIEPPDIGCARQVAFHHEGTLWVYELDERTEFVVQDGELEPVRRLAYHYLGSLRPFDEESDDEGHGGPRVVDCDPASGD